MSAAFQPLTFACLKCGNVVRLGRPKEFGRCACGDSYGDAGDGHYHRLGGSARGMKHRRPKGSVKALVTAAHNQKMSVPELAKVSGLNPHTIYNCAARLGLRLRRVKP